MFKLIQCLFILCFLAYYTSCLSEKRNPSAGSGKCLPLMYNLGMMSYGENKIVENECTLAICLIGGIVDYQGCEEIGRAQNCTYKKSGSNLPFPKCCKLEYCKDDKKRKEVTVKRQKTKVIKDGKHGKHSKSGKNGKI